MRIDAKMYVKNEIDHPGEKPHLLEVLIMEPHFVYSDSMHVYSTRWMRDYILWSFMTSIGTSVSKFIDLFVAFLVEANEVGLIKTVYNSICYAGLFLKTVKLFQMKFGEHLWILYLNI